jgi:hypothetical protein
MDRFNEKRSAIVDRALSNLKTFEAQATADTAQLRQLLPDQEYIELVDVLSKLAEPYAYSIENCGTRIALYDELETLFARVRTTVMTRVQSGLCE